MVQGNTQNRNPNTGTATGPVKTALHWYTKLFAVWIVLFAVVGRLFGQSRYSIISLIVFFIVGFELE